MNIVTKFAIPLFAFHAASLLASAEIFPPDQRLPDGWYKPASADRSWKVTSSEAYEGKLSLVSNSKAMDGTMAAVAYRSDFKTGRVSFRIKVSSEQGYDFARFFIDGVQQTLATQGKNQGLSGNVDWQLVSFPLSAGTHTLQWTYEKDDSYLTGSDCAWLDAVTLPETTQEIAVANAAGENIASGETTSSFPQVDTDSTSEPLTFTIKNKGGAPLFGLKVSTTGADAGDFKVSSLAGDSLGAGKSTTFTVAFAPQTIGQKTAGILITSNDKNEPEFTIALKGKAIGVPLVGATTSSGAKLQDNGKVIGFGSAVTGSKGAIKTFQVVNYGTGKLKGISISKSGKNAGDFAVSQLGTTVLDPGDATTFKITFKPGSTGTRTAVIHIASNDRKSGPFEINVSGTGTAVKASSAGSAASEGLAAAVLGSPAALAAHPAVSVDVVDGRKYLSLTVAKPLDGGVVGKVEVSSNLIDWFSGEKHTTVLIDSATTLKVRDNRPVTPDAKRYIRLR